MIELHGLVGEAFTAKSIGYTLKEQMKHYKYIMFDWDGCLAQTLDVWIRAFRGELALRNINPSEKDIAHKLGDRDLAAYFGVKDEAIFNKAAIGKAKEGLVRVYLYDGAIELLNELKSQSKLALVSSSPSVVLEQGIRHNNIEDVFEVIVSGDDVSRYKPDPESLEKALSAMNGVKEAAIMVGDTANDIFAAHNFGIDSVLTFYRSHELIYGRKEIIQANPTFKVKDLLDLKNIL